MSEFPKRTMVTISPEWLPMLDRLKRETFYNDTQAEMFRYIINRGLNVIKTEMKGSQNECGT